MPDFSSSSPPRRTSSQVFDAAQRLADEHPDYLATTRLQQGRQSAADRALLLALAAANAGQDKAAGFHFGQSEQNANPLRLTGANIDAATGEVAQDPLFRRDQRQQSLERQGTALAAQENAAAMAEANRAQRSQDKAEDRAFKQAMLSMNLTARQSTAGEKANAGDKVAQRSAAQRQRDAAEALALLDQAAPLVDKATSSGIGAARDWAGRLFGMSTNNADAAASLASIGSSLVMRMPRFEGPQSDKDTALYREQAGRIGDPSIPVSQKLSAMKSIRELQERHAQGGVGSPAGGASGSWDNAPTAGTVQGGYRFKGGNPADKKNWVPQ